MQTHSVHGTAPNGAQVELASVTFEDREFEALGSTIDLAAGHAAVYIGSDNRLTTWDGLPIGTYRTVSTWKQYGTHIGPYRMKAIRAHLLGDSRVWHGRYNDDWSQLVFLRPCTGGQS